MSISYVLFCKDCKHDITIGQSSSGEPYIYRKTPDTMLLLEAFLFEHEGHDLSFVDSHHSLVLTDECLHVDDELDKRAGDVRRRILGDRIPTKDADYLSDDDKRWLYDQERKGNP